MENATGSTQAVVKPQEKTLGILVHVLALFTSFLRPLIVYLVRKDGDEFNTHHAKEALNFQIAMMITCFIGFILTFVLIGSLVLAAAGLANLILCIIAAVKASNGDKYRYPLTIRLIK